MSHIAIVTLPLVGHLNPMGALAESLMERGHRVTVVGPPGVCALARTHMKGVQVHALSDLDYPSDRLDHFLGLLPGIKGLSGIRAVIAEIAALSALYLRALPAALETLDADCVLHDQLEPAAGVVARGLGLAHASVACALPMNREPRLPPPYLGWPYRDSPWWRSLYGGAYLVIDRMMAEQNALLDSAARDYGFRARNVSDCVSANCDLSQCIPGFDYPRTVSPAHVGLRDVGPLRRRRPLSRLDFERDGRELVFCSLGTIMGGRLDLFEAVVEACSANVVQCIIAHAGRLTSQEEAKLRALPGHPIVRDFVDQRAVLSEARAAVLHGGFNSVLDALSAGVPMVVLPLAFEQAAIASRVDRAGTGIVVRRPSPKRLRQAVGEALNSRELRQAALGLARAASLAGGATDAARRVEATINDRQKVSA